MCLIGKQIFLFFTGARAFVCNISSPSSNTIEVTCKLFGEMARVNVILTCIDCTDSSTRYSILDDSPVIIPELPAGNYTAEIMTVDMDIVLRAVKMVAISDNVVTATTNTPTNDVTDTTTNAPSTESITTYLAIASVIIRTYSCI